MRQICILVLSILITGCGAVKKKTTYSKTRKVSVPASKEKTIVTEKSDDDRARGTASRSKADEIIDTALKFSGTRYKFGGTTKKGMDCSGLLYVSFGEHDVSLPRTSYHMAEEGKRIKLRNVEKGDLLFFRTRKSAKRINHVGMVVAVGSEIKFIHASSSRGVIVSSLREGFWNNAFVRANRIL